MRGRFVGRLGYALIACVVACGGTASNPTLEEHAAVFGRFRNYQSASYAAMSTEALYLSMRDGIRLALDVMLPAPLAAGERIPTVLVVTRYWRSRAGRAPAAQDSFFTGHGYAVVRVDERGTGASFGTWPHPWPPAALQDHGEIVDWIVGRPWSNGRVGGIGVSYSGTTALLLAATERSAVRAVIPKFVEFDLYPDLGAPGGLPARWLIGTWFDFIRQLDRNTWPAAEGSPPPSVKRVDQDSSGLLLAAAVAEHEESPDWMPLIDVGYRDERAAALAVTWDDFSQHRVQPETERTGTAIYGWGSWMDAATADAVIRRFTTFTNPQRGVIGPWSHGAGHHASPYLAGDAQTSPSPGAQRLEDLRFFERHLKGRDTGADDKVLLYYTMGEEVWKQTATWPVAGVSRRRWFLGPDRSLVPTPSSQAGTDRYTVDFEATTGTATRWHTELGGGDVDYGNRAEADRRLLTYTSATLDRDLEITGHPVVSLWVSSTHRDGAFYVYLEDVHPDGRVSYVTEGQLRARHRKMSADPPPYRHFGPYHTFLRKDSAPLVPGEIVSLEIGLLPTSVLIRHGHRLRLAIAGHDKGLYDRVPAQGTPTVTVAHGGPHVSYIDLPVIRATDSPIHAEDP